MSNPAITALLCRQLECGHQRHLHTAGGIGTRNGSRPQPRDDCGLAAFRLRGLRVQMANALERLVAHPLAVVAYVGGKAGRPSPGNALGLAVLAPADELARSHGHRISGGVHGRLSVELGRQLDERLVDKHGDGIEVRGYGTQPETLGFQRDGSAAREKGRKWGATFRPDSASPRTVRLGRSRHGIGPRSGQSRIGRGRLTRVPRACSRRCSPTSRAR